jgi:hypothetical protein
VTIHTHGGHSPDSKIQTTSLSVSRPFSPFWQYFPANASDPAALRRLQQLYRDFDGHLITWVPMNGANVTMKAGKPVGYSWSMDHDRVS